MRADTAERASWVGFLLTRVGRFPLENPSMPNRAYNPRQGWLLPYAIRPLPPERQAAIAAAAASVETREDDAPEPANADQPPV